MTKAEFIKELKAHFIRIADGAKSYPLAEINQERDRLHAQPFAVWLRTESEKADAERLKNPIQYPTPTAAAEALAGYLETTGSTDWVDHWNGFFAVIANKPGRQWEHREPFVQYMESVEADGRAAAFESYNSGTSITNYLPDVRKEYDKVKNLPHLVKDPRKSTLYRFYAGILTEAKERIAAGEAIISSNEDREMILHFSDLLSPEMIGLIHDAKEDFDRQMIALESHLRKNGFIIPTDFTEFADWFFGVKFQGMDLQGVLSSAKVNEYHFAEFSAWKEGRLKGEADNKPPAKPRIRVLAFYLFYRNPDDRSKKGIQRVGEEYGYNPNSFYNEWRHIFRHDYRTDPRYIEDLRLAIDRLIKEGLDTSKAEQELRTAERTVKK